MKDTLFISGERLRLARKFKSLSQESLVNEKGFPSVSIKTIQRWEYSEIPPNYIQSIAEYFNLNEWAFLSDKVTSSIFRELLLIPDKLQSYMSQLAELPITENISPKPTTAVQSANKESYSRYCIDAIIQNDKASFEKFISLLDNINECIDDYWTLLHWACYYDKLNLVSFLVQHDASLLIQDKNGVTPLMVASMKGHVALVDWLMLEKNHLYIEDNLSWNALTWAASYSQLAVMDILLEQKINPNLMDKNNWTPFVRALYDKNLPVANKLYPFLKNKDEIIQGKKLLLWAIEMEAVELATQILTDLNLEEQESKEILKKINLLTS